MSNAKAKRGYSRDSRPDCKQVVVGLVLDGDGFPKAVTRDKPLGMRLAGAKAFAVNPDECRHSVRISHGA